MKYFIGKKGFKTKKVVKNILEKLYINLVWVK